MQAPKLGTHNFLKYNSASDVSSKKHDREVLDEIAEGHPLFTGRYFLILNKNSKEMQESIHLLEKKWNLSIANTADFKTSLPDETQLSDADALVFDELGVALVGVEKEIMIQMGLSDNNFLLVPEKVVYIPDEIPADNMNSNGATWGIRVTEAFRSQYTGKGVKVAVLDTGFDIHHPDFAGREITTTSFVPDETIEDQHGHGTHCIGIACGSRNVHGLRYGIAPESHIHAGKVLNNNGSGAQSWILNGMVWAANNGCKVLSMSLGSPVPYGVNYDIAYERAARFALSKGVLIVAAAGNDSRRSASQYHPVSSPADCPSILAVTAIDKDLKVGDFSNRAINTSGLVDFAAPGVDVYSSWTKTENYRILSGTSMATPHVAGIAALLFEKFPYATPEMIESELRKNARPLPLPTEDVGVGLSIAP